MKVIESYEDLEIGKYYFCKSKSFDNIDIHKVSGPEENKYIGPNRLWCNKHNNQVFDRYDIIGPVEMPKFN
jgi:hypothetical protein